MWRLRSLLLYSILILSCASWKFPWSRRRPNHSRSTVLAQEEKVTVLDDAFARDIASALDQAAAQAQEKRAADAFTNAFYNLYDQFKRILLYKPPVGIVSVIVLTRLVLTGRIFHLYRAAAGKDSIEGAIIKSRKKRERYLGRSWSLDPDDALYASVGGIDANRRRLCWAALSNMEKDDLVQALSDSLSVTNRPGNARIQFVNDAIEPMSRVAALSFHSNTATSSKTSRISNLTIQQFSRSSIQPSSTQARIMKQAQLTVQARAMDALLRVCRDRLLRTTYRLARTQEYWKSRQVRFVQKLLSDSIEGDRLRLSSATAAYHAELARLGDVAAILMDRPSDMNESYLIQALKATELAKKKQRELQNLAAQSLFQRVASRISYPKVSKYSIRWRADGHFGLSLQKAVLDGEIDGQAATDAILSDDEAEEWLERTGHWIRRARTVVYNVVQDSLKDSLATPHFTEEEFQALESSWCAQTRRKDSEIAKEWGTVLKYVDNLASWRRIGEGKVLQLRDAAIIDWTRRLDILGIPSSLLCIWLAHFVHMKLKPHWPYLRKEATDIYRKVLEILHVRVWIPLKGIVDDIMNKSKGMMSAFSLADEQSSLDHMLRDLGFGDGSGADRRKALQQATQQYEEDLRRGLVRNVLKGRLVRLLLIQVQQLKVGLLSALDTIDVLVKGNRIHFQILAAIPAVFLATFGTKLVLRAIYNIRAQDIRPVTAVHGEMANYLNRIGHILILSKNVDDEVEIRHEDRNGSRRKSFNYLQKKALGEIVLNAHRYLMLLDFSSPPLPSRQCDQVHAFLRQMLGNEGTLKRVSYQRQQEWIVEIKRQHQDLLKHL